MICRAEIGFANAMAFGSSFFDLDEATILVSLEVTYLSIVIPPMAHSAAIYVDVPLGNIHAVSLAASFSRAVNFALQVDLARDEGVAFYVNAAVQEDSCLFIGFESRDICSLFQTALDLRIQTVLAESESPPESPLRDYFTEIEAKCASHPATQVPLPFLRIQHSDILDASKTSNERTENLKLRPTSLNHSQREANATSSASDLRVDPKKVGIEDHCDTSPVQASPTISTTYHPPITNAIVTEFNKSLVAKPVAPAEKSIMQYLGKSKLSQRAEESKQVQKYASVKTVDGVAKTAQASRTTRQNQNFLEQDAWEGKTKPPMVKDSKVASLGSRGKVSEPRGNSDGNGASEDDRSSFNIAEHKAPVELRLGSKSAAKKAAEKENFAREDAAPKPEVPAKSLPTPSLPMPAKKTGYSTTSKLPSSGKRSSKAGRASANLPMVSDDLWDPTKQIDEASLPSNPSKQSNQGKKLVAKTAGRKVPGRLAKTKANEKMESQLNSEELGDEVPAQDAVVRKIVTTQSRPARNVPKSVTRPPSATSCNNELKASAANSHLRKPNIPEGARRKGSTEADVSHLDQSAQVTAQSALKAIHDNQAGLIDEPCSDPPNQDDVDVAMTNEPRDKFEPSNSEAAFVADSFPKITERPSSPPDNTITVPGHYSEGRVEETRVRNSGVSDTPSNPTRLEELSVSQTKQLSSNHHIQKQLQASRMPDVITTGAETTKTVPTARVKTIQDPVAARLSEVLNQDSVIDYGSSSRKARLGHKFAKSQYPQSAEFNVQAVNILSDSANKSRERGAPETDRNPLFTPKNRKRKAEEPRMEPYKQSKMLTPKIIDGNTNTNGTATDRQVSLAIPERKAPMIHFTPSGPQNQGTAPKSRLRKAFAPRGKLTACQPEPAQISGKRSSESIGTRLNDLPSNSIPLTIPAIPLVNRQGIKSSTHRERSLPSGSQRKITETGSPIILPPPGRVLSSCQPCPHQNENEGIPARIEVDDDGDYQMQDEDMPTYLNAERPVKVAKHPIDLLALISQKQQPSSPLAPSTHTSLPLHYIQSNGKILNTKTKEAVVPVQPQNPFAADTEPRTNSFMDKLRESIHRTAQKEHQSISRNNLRTNGPNETLGQVDEDTTLIEPDSPKTIRKVRREPVEISSSESSSEDEDSSWSSSSEASIPISSRASSPFEPHQKELYLLMCNIVKVRHRLKYRDHFSNLDAIACCSASGQAGRRTPEPGKQLYSRWSKSHSTVY